MAGDSRPNGKPASYYIEWSYVQARAFVLNFLALGTMLMFYRIGSLLAETAFPTLPWMLWIMRALMVATAYYAVDWGLKIVLTDASTAARPPAYVKDISGNKIEPDPKRSTRYLWQIAILAVSITTGVSLTSNLFVSADLSGQSHLPRYIESVEREALRDSVMKMQAFTLLQNAPSVQRQMREQARKQGDQLLLTAINSGTPSWKKDYYAHRNNAKAWFWTCQQCPKGYKDYRSRILSAARERDALLEAAEGYTQGITASLSPTLSRNPAADSTLQNIQSAIYSLEAERKSRQRTINFVLMLMTIAGAVLALVLTWLLKKHRLYHGQLINDNPARFLMVATDIANRIRRIFSDILYSITFHQHERALKRGYIVSYTVEEQNVTASLHATVSSVKRCQWCEKPLRGKRSDAKYCDDECRNKANTDKRRSRAKAV